MSPSIEDPRNYISIKPLPKWKDAQDSKLKARTLHNYTLEWPTREQVFRANYARRLYQMTAQGYQSVAWKPYQEVGKPLYLSPKTLLQTSLGQTHQSNENSDQTSAYSGDEENEKGRSNQIASSDKKSSRNQFKATTGKGMKSGKQMSTASFLMRHREHKDLQNIVKDLTTVRESMAKVKMGHALFPMLEKEHNERNNAFLLDRQNEIRSAKANMRIHSVTSDEANKHEGDDQKPRVTANQVFSTKQMLLRSSSRASMVSVGSATSGNSAAASLVARKAEVTKSLAEQARPFTPVHSNISLNAEAEDVHSCVQRQLCALHWILVACQVEANIDNQYQHKTMIPLSECWDQLNLGGKTRDSRAVLQEKRNNTKWTKFTRSATYKLGGRSRSRKKNPTFPMHLQTIRKNPSVASELGAYQGDSSNIKQTPSSARLMLPNQETGGDDYLGDYPGVKKSRPSSPGQSSVTTTIAGGTVVESEYGDDDAGTEFGYPVTDGEKRREQEECFSEKDCHEHLKKLLSTVKESVTNEMQRRERTAQVVAETNHRLPLSVYEWARNSYFKIGKKEVNISKIVVPAATYVTDYSQETKPIKKSASVARIRPHTAATTRRRDSSAFASTDNHVRPGTAGRTTGKPKRPMSSPAKLVTQQFNFKFSSAEKKKHLGQIRENFQEVNDVKALELHKQLTELEKRRKKRMEIKFETMKQTISMQRDLAGMRNAVQTKFKEDRMFKKKRSCMLPCDWYNTLSQNLPEDIHENENCNLVLQKLGMLAMKMSNDKTGITPDAFLGALRALRPWELCAPDVSSAIEFTRENVVQMDADEFDEWRASKLHQSEPIVGSDSKPKQ